MASQTQTLRSEPGRSTAARARSRASARSERILIAGLIALAAYNVALAVWMAFFPRSFFSSVGPFGIRNDHYTRDNATYAAAIGVALAIAVRRPSWRVPVLAMSALQFALHSLNHLLDIDGSHPAWNGPADFASLALGTLAVAWLLAAALGAQRRRTPSPTQGAST